MAIMVIGLIFLYGTAGTCDYEAETGQTLMSDVQFYLHIIISLVMLVGGYIGTRICDIKEN